MRSVNNYCLIRRPAATCIFEPFRVQVRARLQKMGALASMNIFLRQEIDRMQRVITLVRQTLTDLKLAIEGTIIMSEVCLLPLHSLPHIHVR